jgi:hypothetical protein
VLLPSVQHRENVEHRSALGGSYHRSRLTLRQWVLTVPFELRLLLAAKPDALSAIGRIFIQEIQRWQRQQAAALGFERAEGAAVSFCQRCGSSLNLNIHWHVIVPDALFVPDATGEHVDTLKHHAPTRLDLEEIVTTVATRCVRWLDKHGRVATRMPHLQSTRFASQTELCALRMR